MKQRSFIRKDDICYRLCRGKIIITVFKSDEATEFPDTEIKTYALYADPDGRRPVRKTSQTKPTKSAKSNLARRRNKTLKHHILKATKRRVPTPTPPPFFYVREGR